MRYQLSSPIDRVASTSHSIRAGAHIRCSKCLANRRERAAKVRLMPAGQLTSCTVSVPQSCILPIYTHILHSSLRRPLPTSLLLPFLLLPSFPIPLLQPRHPRATHLRILRKESIQIVRLHYRAQLDFLFVLYAVFALGFAVCRSDDEWEWVRGMGVPERVVGDFLTL